MRNEHETIWLVIFLLISFFGGVTRYLLSAYAGKAAPTIQTLLSALTISIFWGLLGGIICVNYGLNLYEAIVISGSVSFFCGGCVYR
ncbi:phage holin family protein [Pantoea anthophila]|uniref:phage holin family protein n=1 Tax=Pantoea anthophila TaxID=470931 RepID=UPI002DB9AC52|nr:phage holin family protein [Pantoea anthophila]MEB6223323.1 phage holin family protein [Pantoea anthophila]